ncbi:hypothetical protein PAMA_016260 [Pampus argenteus]
MDETEKYKQRLEAIAEKRRLQEEQDKARREMEDEKLRLQQLKRKSLRDQWLMEGPPLSPTSLNAQSPRSPPWDSQSQEIERHPDKLQAENQHLAEEEEKLKEQMEEAVKVEEAGVEINQDGVVQNGENNTTGSETTEEVKTNQIPLLEEAATVLTNGREDTEANINHDTEEQITQSTTNGPIEATECVSMLEPGLSLGVSEADLGPVHEEEEGTLVMRAECVIITDEGDDVPEDLTSQEDQHETMQPEEPPLSNPEAGPEGGEAVEELLKTEAAPETSPESEKRPTPEAQPAIRDVDVKNEKADGEPNAEAKDNQVDGQASVQVLSPANALEGTKVALVPVYSEVQPSAITLDLGAEGEAAMAAEEAEAALKVQDPATIADQFQEVPLANPQEKQRTEAEPAEQEPLLSQAKSPNTQAEPAAASNPASTNRGEGPEAPKHKTCQCCSVM